MITISVIISLSIVKGELLWLVVQIAVEPSILKAPIFVYLAVQDWFPTNAQTIVQRVKVMLCRMRLFFAHFVVK